VDQVKDGPERLSTGELVHLIDEIAAGRGSTLFPEGGIPEDAYWPSDFPAKPGLDAIQDQVKREQSVIDEKLKAGGPIYAVTAYGPNRVHLSTCHHVSHALDRTEAWKAVVEDYATLRPADVRVTKMPRLFTRQEAEALNSYVVCTVCAPELDHQRKKFRFPARPMKAKSFGLHHVGRAVFTLEGEDLGLFISHQRIVSAQGIRSITTTTQRVIEGHGDCEEQFIVAPKDLM
jgi:hypothetical protein